MACVCRILYVLLAFLWFFCNLGVSIYILRAGEPVTPNRTLFSAGGEFALGFFCLRNSSSSSSSSFLGIWYTKGPLNNSVIWVAKRESPLSHQDSEPLFKVGDDGNLQLLDGGGKTIWSTNISGAGLAGNPVEAYLQNNGNLILKQGDSPVWESFDDAGDGDTLMPEMKLKVNTKTRKQNIIRSWTSIDDPRPGKFSWGMDPKGSLQFFIWKENSPYYRSNLYQDGFAKSLHYSRLGHTTTYSFAAENDEVYFRYVCDNPLIQMRFVLTPDGYIEAMLRKTKSDKWRIPWKVPTNPCELYARCGSFGSCEKTGFSDSICRCLEGFKPKSQREWDNGNYSAGCERKREFRCHSKDDKFKKLQKMKWPDYSVSLGNMAFGECQAQCYSNCSCTAFAYANISEHHPANCLNWFGDLVDLTYNYSVGVNAFGQDLYVRVHSSELDNGSSGNGLSDHHEHKDHYLVAKIVAPVSGFFLVCVLVYILRPKCFKSKADRLCKRPAVDSSMSTSPLVGNDEIELLQFRLQRIIDATNNFDTTNKLGEGGFGPVYKGFLSEFGMVAIKRLSKRSSQGLEEFMNELKLIAKLQHTNLVSLLGCCIEDEEKILIYEYLPKRSLDKFLFDPLEKHHLDWSTRAQIIEGIAQGILYLHKYSRLKVIHRDLKASNILLCETMKPKISDFGMARIFGLNQTQAETNHVVGTYGYIPPEYVLRGQFSEKSDVFSFGVLLLEIVSGQKNSEFFHQTQLSDTLLGWAWVNWKEGKPLEFVDPAIRESCDSLKVIRCIEVGLLCVQTIPTDRPTMSNVVRLLCTDHATPIPPLKEPAFVASHSNANVSTSHREVSDYYSQNEITISVLESR